MEQRIFSWQRITALALTVAVHMLVIVILLLQPAWMPPLRDVKRTLVTFQLSPEPKVEPAVQKPIPEKHAKAEPQPVPAPVETVAPPPVIPPVIVLPLPPIEKPPPLPDTGTAAIGQGEAPKAKQINPVKWRDGPPTADQLLPYMPIGAPPARSGTIICQTAANYRVRNCRVVDELPSGSGLARAMQRASGSFRIEPPIIDGQPLIGGWITIGIKLAAP